MKTIRDAPVDAVLVGRRQARFLPSDASEIFGTHVKRVDCGSYLKLELAQYGPEERKEAA